MALGKMGARGGFSSMGKGGKAASGTVPEDSATTAWVAAVVGDGGSVSAGRRTLVNTLIAGLRSDSVLTKLDRLWLLAAENTQSALRDVVAASAATAVLAPTFTVDAGYLGNGTSQYIDTNFNPTTAPSPKYVQDSASLFAWSNTSTGLSGALIGLTNSGSNQADLFPRFTDNNLYAGVNEASFFTVASSDAKGFWAANRSAAAASQFYKDGSSIGSNADASTAPSNNKFFVMALVDGGTTYWNGIALAAGFGQSLTAGEHLLLYGRLHTYMQTVAGVP